MHMIIPLITLSIMKIKTKMHVLGALDEISAPSKELWWLLTSICLSSKTLEMLVLKAEPENMDVIG